MQLLIVICLKIISGAKLRKISILFVPLQTEVLYYMNKLSRIEEEKQTIAQMIHFYCRHKEKNQTLCSACSELLKYAHQRLEHCPFGERKKTCRQCTVHCYHPKMRQKIKEVMRFAGPRMIWYHPIWTLKHLWRER